MDYRKLTADDLKEAGNNDFLADELADYIEGNFLLTAPKNLKASILHNCSRPDVRLAAGNRAIPRQIRLLLYSLKVGAAVAASILLLAFLPASSPTAFRIEHPSAPSGTFFQVPLYEKARKVTDRLNFISYELYNWEVYRHDKQKE